MANSINDSYRPQPTFFYALKRYGQVLFALLQREFENRRRSPLESIADVLEPVLFVSILALLWSFLNRRTSAPIGGHPLLFIATGFYAKFLWISLSKMGRRALGSPSRRFPVERRLDYIFVHLVLTLGEYILLAFFGFGIIYIWFTTLAFPANFFPIVEAMLAITALGFGWGIITMVISKYFWPWAYISGGFNRAMILFSGIFYLVEFLPPNARAIMSYNPMLHAVALFRTGFYPNYPTILLNKTYLLECCLVAVVVGFVLERVTLRTENE